MRNIVAWVRSNPPPGALGDKWRPGHSLVVVACKSATRYWDDLATRTVAQGQADVNTNGPKAKRAPADVGTGWLERRVDSNPNGAPLLDWWLINSDGYSGSHYATFPPELVIPLVQAMTPYRVCRKCGQPSRRITSETTYERNGEPCEADAATFAGLQERRANVGHSTAVRDTIGWSDCGHDDWRAGHVLDPFAGSGTSLMVAHGHGRAVTGIDLDERNAWLIRDRLGMFLTVE